MNKVIIHKSFWPVLVIVVMITGCAPGEKHVTDVEELKMKQFREEGLRRSPQEQRAYECAEWHMRHPGSTNLPNAVLEGSYEPPECAAPPAGGDFDPARQQRKNVDEIIDRQLKEQSERK